MCTSHSLSEREGGREGGNENRGRKMERDMKAAREEFGSGAVGNISHCCNFIIYY